MPRNEIDAADAAAAMRRSGWLEVAVEDDLLTGVYVAWWVRGPRAAALEYRYDGSHLRPLHIVFVRQPGGLLHAVPTVEQSSTRQIAWSCYPVLNDDNTVWYYVLEACLDGVFVADRTIDVQCLRPYRGREQEFLLAVTSDMERRIR